MRIDVFFINYLVFFNDFQNEISLWFFQVEALRTIEALTETEINASMGKYNQDKNEVERNITMKLREIEEANVEIAYYKSICIPNEEEALEVKRLQDNETRLLSSNATLNKELIVVAHE